MNLPNRLTVLRAALVPVFLFFMMSELAPAHYLWALVVFVAASLTDLLDGQIARKYNMVTDFGKFMDPLADKVLVMSAMLCFVQLQWTPAVAVVVILAREFLVTSLRLIAAGGGKVIAADIWGKLKTVVQMVWVPYAILLIWMQDSAAAAGIFPALFTAERVLMWASVILTVISGVNYVWKNRSCINTMK